MPRDTLSTPVGNPWNFASYGKGIRTKFKFPAISSDPNGTSAFYIRTYVDGQFSTRADQWPRADAMMFCAAFSF